MFLTTSGKDERSNSVELEQLGVGLGNLRNLHIHGLGAQADILAGGLWVGIGQEEFDDAGHVGLDQLAALLAVDGQSVAHLVKELSDLVDRHVGLEEILDLVEEQLTDRAGQVGIHGLHQLSDDDGEILLVGGLRAIINDSGEFLEVGDWKTDISR
jgi:hypothetical protein